MRILVVCRMLPYPPDHGVKIRLFNLVKHLSKKHSISLLCYEDPETQQNHVRTMREYCDCISQVNREKKSKARQLPSVTKNLILGLPWNVKYSKSREMTNAILKRIN